MNMLNSILIEGIVEGLESGAQGDILCTLVNKRRYTAQDGSGATLENRIKACIPQSLGRTRNIQNGMTVRLVGRLAGEYTTAIAEHIEIKPNFGN